MINIGGPFTRVELVNLNLNSHHQVKEYLLSQGWVPTQYNYNKKTKERTSPKLTEDSYDSIKGDLGQLIAKRNVLRHRRNSIKNFKDPDKGIVNLLRSDGRIEADGITCATPTARYTHSKVVNIPSPPAILGEEMRSIFCVLPPYKFLGADLSAIEARILGHYTGLFDGGEYASVLLEGDIHINNAQMIYPNGNLMDKGEKEIKKWRGIAKSFLYATMYGAGVAKLASILGCTPKQAQKLIQQFWEGNPALNELVNTIKGYYKKHGFIKGLDGRKLFIRSEHILLNSLIQSAAAIVFKRWMIMANLGLSQIDIEQIIAMHDELQYRCHEDCVAEAIPIIESTCIKAGEYYELSVPTVAECSVGSTWLDTH